LALVIGHVTWKATKLLPDSGDVGTAPDTVAATAFVTFMRPQGFIVDTASPETVFVKPQAYAVDSDGVLRDGQGEIGIDLPIGPWKVVFNVPGFVPPQDFLFQVVAGQTVDLSNVTPLTDATALQLIVKGDPGPQGPAGPTGAAGAAGSATTDASALTTGTLPTARIADGSLGIVKLSATGTRSSSTFLRGDGTFAAPAAGSVASTGITDSTAVGRAVLTAADATAGRTAIGAGTGSSNLAIGTTSTTAAAGDHTHDTRYVRTVNGTGPDGAGNVAVSASGTDPSQVIRDIYGLKAVPYDPLLATTTQAMTSGTMYVTRVAVIPGEVLTTFQTYTSAAGTAVTLYQAALYLLDGTLVRSTANMTPGTAAMQPSAWQNAGSNATYTVPVGVTSMYIGLLSVATTTAPTILRSVSPATSAILQFTMSSGQRASTRTGLAAIPSPMGAVTASNVATLLAST
jgi:hypothetical protein